jgi:hypothetical protein
MRHNSTWLQDAYRELRHWRTISACEMVVILALLAALARGWM